MKGSNRVHFSGRIRIRPLLLSGVLFLLLSLLLAAFSPGPAYADGISGFAEFNGSLSNVRGSTAGVDTDKSESRTFSQRYSLSLDRSLYPFLKLSAGGLFDKTLADANLNGVESSGEVTQVSPRVNLTIGTSPVSAALGYARNETTTSGSTSSSATDVIETYNGRLGLRPEGLPSLNLLASRSNTFDKYRIARDSSSDFYSLNSRYQPLTDLNLNYSASFSETEDLKSNQKTQSLSNSARGDYTYTQNFFRNRVSLSSNASLNGQESSTSTGGSAGEITTSLGPHQAGFFAVSDTPTLVPAHSLIDAVTVTEWTSFPALIDIRKDQPIPSINLGVLPVIGGDARQRNLGLDLGLNLQANSVSTIHVYVNQQLPGNISGQFRWAVYTSSDNLNWELRANNIQAAFETNIFDPQQQIPVQRFVITFPQIPVSAATRFIKVVTAPLSRVQAIAPFDAGTQILVTEMEALVRTPTAEGGQEQKTASLGGSLGTMVKTKLFERPGLTSVQHDVNIGYNFNRSNPGTATDSWFLTNGLSANHRFSKKLTGNSRLSWEEAGGSGQVSTSAYSWSASLQAVPLSTLRHTLIYSGRYAPGSAGSTSSNSVALTNSAQLYQGVSASLNGGVSFATNETGAESRSTFGTFGVNLTPHRTVSLNAGLSETHSASSGGGRADSSTFTRTGELSASYNPISAVYLLGSVGFSSQNDRETVISRNFGGGWSPFRDGAIQLNISYNESLSSAGDSITRLLSSSLRWNIRPGWWLDTGYALVTTEQTAAVVKTETKSSSVSSNLRIAF